MENKLYEKIEDETLDRDTKPDLETSAFLEIIKELQERNEKLQSDLLQKEHMESSSDYVHIDRNEFDRLVNDRIQARLEFLKHYADKGVAILEKVAERQVKAQERQDMLQLFILMKSYNMESTDTCHGADNILERIVRSFGSTKE